MSSRTSGGSPDIFQPFQSRSLASSLFKLTSLIVSGNITLATCFLTDSLLVMNRRQVHPSWYHMLPGDNPDIARKLFLKADFSIEENDGGSVDGEYEIEEEASDDSVEYVGEEDENDDEVYHTEGGYGRKVSEPMDIPCILVLLRAPLSLDYPRNELPQLNCSIDIMNAEEDDFERCTDFAEDTIFHPMVQNIADYMDLVNRKFSMTWVHPRLKYHSLGDLYYKTRMPTDGEYIDASWKNMLICRPAVRKVILSLRWPHIHAHRLYTIEAEEGYGVTVGQFVYYTRRMLSHAKNDVEGFSRQMMVFCQKCGSRDEWYEREGWEDE
ncbi:hypothetical protein T440DRAFT_463450 [Plenodomus tracheiphilus IPT5]|uniref:Uncharacterized protein n=1 Tax=Plenodomus tracheiphilus IPT5 TaxID=1408161 RepID=A0A6A7BMT5_9PLEO|nr:hypothetical protein T440DRAFT_463450 [Plenodomus tracheiphilus IPT5]